MDARQDGLSERTWQVSGREEREGVKVISCDIKSAGAVVESKV